MTEAQAAALSPARRRLHGSLPFTGLATSPAKRMHLIWARRLGDRMAVYNSHSYRCPRLS